MPLPVPVKISRNMTVIRDGDALTIVNSMRLDDAGLAALDALGTVQHVIRLAAFHGMDDPFYQRRYGARVWALKDTLYTSGFDATDQGKVYFEPDVAMGADTPLPIPGARLIVIGSATPPEGLLLLERDGGVIIAGDILQNWAKPDAYFNVPGKLMMKTMGFLKPHNIGPGWLKATKPDPAELHALADLSYEHVLPAHGAAVLGGACGSYQPKLRAV